MTKQTFLDSLLQEVCIGPKTDISAPWHVTHPGVAKISDDYPEDGQHLTEAGLGGVCC